VLLDQSFAEALHQPVKICTVHIGTVPTRRFLVPIIFSSSCPRLFTLLLRLRSSCTHHSRVILCGLLCYGPSTDVFCSSGIFFFVRESGFGRGDCETCGGEVWRREAVKEIKVKERITPFLAWRSLLGSYPISREGCFSCF